MKSVPANEVMFLAVGFLSTVLLVVFLILYEQKRKTGRWPRIKWSSNTRLRTKRIPLDQPDVTGVPDIIVSVPDIGPSPAFLALVQEQHETEEVFRALGIPDDLTIQDLEEELGTEPESRSAKKIDAESAFAAVEDLVRGEVGLHPILDLDMRDRKHVMISGLTGNGKTQSQIAMMTRDIRRGAQVFWLSPHLALYNSEDQPTDLRPIEKHFTQVFEYADILSHLEAFVRVIQQRIPRYRANEPVGHYIVVYLDEWPGIVQVCGEGVTEALQFIAREGRKVRVFLNIATQDALVKTIGMESGVREQFETRLAGRVDPVSWRVLIGGGVPQVKPERKGEWFWSRPDGVQKVQIDPAGKWEISEIAQMAPREFEAIEIVPSGNNLSNERVHQLMMVSRWIGENADISNREIARRLWPQSGSGGGTWATRARLLREEVLSVTVTDAPESGVTEPVTVTDGDGVTVTEDSVTPVTAITAEVPE